MADYRKRLSDMTPQEMQDQGISASASNYGSLFGNRKEKPLSVKAAEIGVEATPVGTAYTIDDIIEEFDKDEPDYKKIALMTVGEAVGLVPYVGEVGQSMVRKGLSNTVGKVDNTIDVKSNIPTVKRLDSDISEAERLLDDPDAMKAWQEQNKLPETQRQANPEESRLAAEALFEGEATSQETRRRIREAIPAPQEYNADQVRNMMPTVTEVTGALGKKAGKYGIIGVKGFDLEAGQKISSRLDIPAYNTYDTWVVSIHDGTKDAGSVVGFGQAIRLENINFGSKSKEALDIARGKRTTAAGEDKPMGKSTIARIFGEYVPQDPKELQEIAAQIIESGSDEWTQVGMNPYRGSAFYDKKTGTPVFEADEVIQVGPLVLAKNVKKPTISQMKEMGVKTRDGKPRMFNEGGMAMDEQMNAIFKSSRGYAEGGLPEGVDMQRVDPVSGNEIPPGSLAAEVRDDIPAQLSEGEYVVPADVVRYYGVKFFEDLRGEAKMGWQSMEKNGRIGGEPMGPAGMEMGNDELPFDLSELQFDEVDVPEENVLKAAEGMYVSGYGFGDFVKALFGGGGKSSSSSSSKSSSDRGYDDSSNGKSDLDRRYEKAKSEYQQREAERKSKSSWGDASENKGYQAMSQSMRDTFGVQKPEGPGLLETLKGYVPDMPTVDWEMGGSPQERAARKQKKGVYGYADGGWAKSPGDPGYEEEGALGLGAEGLALQGGLEMRKFENAAGDIKYIPFIDGVAQIEIPEGYYPFGEVPAEERATTTTSGEAAPAQQTGAEEDDGYTKPMQSINFQELSNEELKKMLDQQQSLTGNAIAAGAGIINPILGLAVKFAMIDTSKRIKRELERRAADPSLTPEQKAEVAAMLETSKKDQPGLLKRLFEGAKDAIEDVIDPPLSKEQKEAAAKVNKYNIPTGLGTESETQKEERLMDQYVEAPTSQGIEPPSPITVEELPPAEVKPEVTPEDKKVGSFDIKQEDGPVVYFDGKPIVRFDTTENAEKFVEQNMGLLPQQVTYDDLLMGDESPVNKTLSLDEIVSTAEGAIAKLGDIRDTAIKKGMEAGQNLENDPLAFMQAIMPEVYTPSTTVPRVPVKKSSATTKAPSLVTKPTTSAPATTKKTSSNIGDSTDWSAVRNEAKQKSTKAIVNATNNLATKEEIDDMKAAAKRVDSYLADKESGKNTSGVYGFAEGGTVETQYTGLDAVKDMQKLNQYI